MIITYLIKFLFSILNIVWDCIKVTSTQRLIVKITVYANQPAKIETKFVVSTHGHRRESMNSTLEKLVIGKVPDGHCSSGHCL